MTFLVTIISVCHNTTEGQYFLSDSDKTKVGVGLEYPTWHKLSHFRGSLHSQSLDWYQQTKQYRKIRKISSQKLNNAQYSKTKLPWFSHLSLVRMETRRAYSTMLTSPFVFSGLCIVFVMSVFILCLLSRIFQHGPTWMALYSLTVLMCC